MDGVPRIVALALAAGGLLVAPARADPLTVSAEHVEYRLALR
jgi:hypothetical protein